jgi:hypothetical protein
MISLTKSAAPPSLVAMSSHVRAMNSTETFAIKAATFEKVVAFCERHADSPMRAIPKPLVSGRLSEVVDAWDAEFIDVDQSMLFELIMIANTLDIQSLMDLGCAAVAAAMVGKSPEEIRTQFNITYSPRAGLQPVIRTPKFRTNFHFATPQLHIK